MSCLTNCSGLEELDIGKKLICLLIVICILIQNVDRYLLSCAAASEGTSPAKPEMTVAAERQCLPSMYWP